MASISQPRLAPAAPGDGLTIQSRPRGSQSAGWLSLRHSCAAAVALWIYLLVPRSIADPDVWWHLRNAAIEWQTHAWLHRDLYSFTAAGAPWINHEWLAELPFYLGWQLAGDHGLYLVTLLLIECIFLGVFRLARNQADHFGSKRSLSGAAPAIATVLASVLATVSFGPRTLLFGWACLVVELLLLERFERHENAVFSLPLLFALWVNLHGSWLIGLTLLLVFTLCGCLPIRVGDISNLRWTSIQRRKLAAVFLLSIGALFVNPYGWRLVFYPFDLAFHQRLNIANVEEWQPLNLQSTRALILLLSVAVLFLAQLLWRRRWKLAELAFAAIGIYAAFLHTRFLFLAAILVMPLLAGPLQRLVDILGRATSARDPAGARRVHAAMQAAMLLLSITVTVRSAKPAAAEDKFPTSALPFLQSFPLHGRMFNECLWGGYLAFHVPRISLFIDSRMDIYERNGTLRNYLDIVRLKNSLGLLDRYNIRYVLFERDAPLVYLLQQTRGWKPAYDDGRVILLERIASHAGETARK